MKYKVWGCLFALAVLLSGCQDESDSGEAQASEAGSNLIAQTSTSTVAPACSDNTFVLAGVVRAVGSGAPVQGDRLSVVPILGDRPLFAPSKDQTLWTTTVDTYGGFVFTQLPLADYYALYHQVALTAEPLKNSMDERMEFIQTGTKMDGSCLVKPPNHYTGSCDGWLIKRGEALGLSFSFYAGFPGVDDSQTTTIP